MNKKSPKPPPPSLSMSIVRISVPAVHRLFGAVPDMLEVSGVLPPPLPNHPHPSSIPTPSFYPLSSLPPPPPTTLKDQSACVCCAGCLAPCPAR